MRIQRFTFIIAFLCGTTVLIGQSAEEWFQKGNTAYTNAAYKQAQEAYLKALEAGEESAALYYNLGNTYYRMNQVAESIYYFEKGLMLDPDDADLKNNILFAKNMTVDAIEKLPITQIAAWQQAWMSIFSLQQWSLLSVLFIWFFFFLMIAYLLQKAVRTKKRLFILYYKNSDIDLKQTPSEPRLTSYQARMYLAFFATFVCGCQAASQPPKYYRLNRP